MRRRKWIFAIGLAALFAVLASTRSARSARVFVPALFGMHRAADRVYVEAPVDARAIIDARAQARRTVVAFYGDARADPTIIACATHACYRRFGGAGNAQGHMFGGRLLLSPRGHGAVAIAHEWAHAELVARAGYLARVPSWFDEGLATLASGDPRYSEAAFQRLRAAPGLDRMRTLRGFLSVPNAYLTARHEVARWYGKVGRRGVLALFDALRRGEDFDAAYRRIELE